ncbi:IS1182 family transposase (plasmid) [Ligilactobacillus salivarius]|uniref:IS1182 family transposase n=1 Tax=Ligilactobacillus salivarius TaxID=1624 RepID=A0ABD7YX94_9LACO|nr:IS1182 family transposase [Ligilactobacillus salivarius]WHS05091.1 IS1182 family transposase [Ligilactobacillus salivarius]WHS09179.1 IS1182 family transposase [Ligilactobacillus salivarius]WHS11200.1 IS1182 family transposase [Ligilactobacillus salivarius]WHS15182.1 IS1182 family transposase [Ligilactobacillus salivarius]WHS18606.1 IS1182 family transposase [Ligilactobacillus salivarius]
MYQNYTTGQTEFVLNFDFTVSSTHIVRLIDAFVDSIPNEILLKDNVSTTGRPLSHPAIMLKILLFAYSRQTYSGRKIELMLEENIPMRWLARDNHYSYHTINNFRSSSHASELIKQSFVYFSLALKDHDLIKDDAVFIDGTKIEADANKYSFTWKKSVQKYHNSLKEKASALYEELVEKQVIESMDLETVQSSSGMELISENITEEIAKLNEEIEQEPKVIKGGSPKKRRRRFLGKTKRQLDKDFIPRAKKYEEAERIFQGRNSFSKTDHDATFMCMKEDPMRNRELKPGYNLQIATHNQFVLDYGLFANPTDTRTLVPFLNQFHSTDFFNYIVADAGYGSEYNYTSIIDQFEKEPLIPYNTILKEQKRKFKNDLSKPQNWPYNEEDDYYIDHLGVRFSFYRYSTRKDKYGFKRDLKIYQADKIQLSSELDELAKTSSGRQRQIQVNQTWNYYKEKIKENLSSDEGQDVYRRRKYDVEPVFGRMKRDFGVRRTHLRGQKPVENDIGLVLMSMNLVKLGKMIAQFSAKYIENIKIRLQILNNSKFWSRIIFLEAGKH